MPGIRAYPHRWMGLQIKKVAIVGGSTSRKDAPFHDRSWEVWAFSNRRLRVPRADRWFEIHAIQVLRRLKRSPSRRSFREHWAHLRKQRCPVYLQRRHPHIPNSVEYPLAEALQEFGRCFTSSAAYAVALAIMEGYEGIGLWGVDLTVRRHYVHQRAGLEYLVSLAKARGIQVYLPPTSRIRLRKACKPVSTRYLYGYDWNARGAWWNRRPRRKKRSRKPVRRRVR